jgi:protein associated with RNAse G/E
MSPEAGSYVYIQSYKHDGSLHRTWCRGFVLEADEQHIVAVTDRAWVIESDGRQWLTREPAVCFFYMHKWFNVISMIRHTGVFYYCNLASPSIYDGEAIRNIDYDLDVKLYPDGGYSILDENEYAENAASMHYSDITKKIVEKQMDDLIHMMEKGEDPFNQDCIDHYYQMYLNMTADSK